MIRFFLLALLALPLVAKNHAQMVELAQTYEAKGDMQNALLWYKKAALLHLETPQEEASKKEQQEALLEGSLKEMPLYVRQYERAKIYSSHLNPIEDEASEETILQMISGTFGLIPYQANYLAPASYNGRGYEGRKKLETKFQFSFQKELAHNWLGLEESYSFGYTQTAWWQILQDSSPFRETNYQPELFVTIPYKETGSTIKAFKFGYLHESNGKDGQASRSWDRLYASTFLQIGTVFVSPRIWYRLRESERKDDNSDIHEYLGYGDITFLYPKGRNLLKGTLSNNLSTSHNRGGINLEWTFPLTYSGLFGFVQYYYGYGESLIDYDKSNNRISIGFAFSR